MIFIVFFGFLYFAICVFSYTELKEGRGNVFKVDLDEKNHPRITLFIHKLIPVTRSFIYLDKKWRDEKNFSDIHYYRGETFNAILKAHFEETNDN